MNSCCDDFGNCRQGRDCPVRSTHTKDGGETVETEETEAEGIAIAGLVVLAIVLPFAFAALAWMLGRLL